MDSFSFKVSWAPSFMFSKPMEILHTNDGHARQMHYPHILLFFQCCINSSKWGRECISHLTNESYPSCARRNNARIRSLQIKFEDKSSTVELSLLPSSFTKPLISLLSQQICKLAICIAGSTSNWTGLHALYPPRRRRHVCYYLKPPQKIVSTRVRKRNMLNY